MKNITLVYIHEHEGKVYYNIRGNDQKMIKSNSTPTKLMYVHDPNNFGWFSHHVAPISKTIMLIWLVSDFHWKNIARMTASS